MSGPTWRTDPSHPDARDRGRRYAIPFDRVWTGALTLVARDRGWTLAADDEIAGTIEAEVRGWPLPSAARIRIDVVLDEDGQTRVDLASTPEKGSGGVGRARRRVRRFLRALDNEVGASPATTLDPRGPSIEATLILLVSLIGGACGGGDAGEGPASESVSAEASDSTVVAVDIPATRYERSFVFVSEEADSMLALGWSMESASRPSEVIRRSRGAAHFAGSWQEVHRAELRTGASPSPWRIIPDSVLRLLVDDADGIEELRFEVGPPGVALTFGDRLSEWTSPRGGVFRLSEANAMLGDRSASGRMIDVTRSWEDARGAVPGDWALLLSGDSLAIFLQASDEESETWQAWARRGVQTLAWPELTVTWGAVRAFDRARRDVPVSWTITEPGGGLSGLLELRTADVEAGEGEGPVLPVDGFFDLAGRLVLGGTEVPVRGLLRHIQR